jgi:hypothetical protein
MDLKAIATWVAPLVVLVGLVTNAFGILTKIISAWTWLYRRLFSDSAAKLPEEDAALPIGSLAYVEFLPQVEYHLSTNTYAVWLQVSLENTSSKLVHYMVNSIRGHVNGKTIPNPEHPELQGGAGHVYPLKRSLLRYQRIDGVDLSKRELEGQFSYDVAYSTVPETIKRRSARQINFKFPIPQADNQPIGTVQGRPISVGFANEIEE